MAELPSPGTPCRLLRGIGHQIGTGRQPSAQHNSLVGEYNAEGLRSFFTEYGSLRRLQAPGLRNIIVWYRTFLYLDCRDD
jgi:hypothetical protein